MTWIFRDILNLFIDTPIGSLAFAFCLMFFDYFYSLPAYYLGRALRGAPQWTCGAPGQSHPLRLVSPQFLPSECTR